MHISHVAGNLSHANEESQPRHVITLLISTQASSGKVRREELKNFSFHSLFLCQIGVTVYSRRRRLQFSALDLRRSQRAPGTLLWTLFFWARSIHQGQEGHRLLDEAGRQRLHPQTGIFCDAGLLRREQAVGTPLSPKPSQTQPNQLLLLLSRGCQLSAFTSR